MAARCCADCFDDRGLKKSIIPSISNTRGTCDYCGSPDVDLVEPRELVDYFQLLTNVYEPDPAGKPLVEWMKDDWRLFSHARLDAANASALIAANVTGVEIINCPHEVVCILADLSQYVVAERARDFLSSVHVRYIYDEGCFRTRYRVDGQPLWHQSVTPKNSSTTQSPFITLAARE